MRSLREIGFRLRQETANVALWLRPPSPRLETESPLAGLPDPSPTLARLWGTPWAAEMQALAESFLAHRFPLLGREVSTGPQIRWRRDPERGLETPARYFRSIPYLDCSRSGDHKLIWELNRHQHLVLLAQAYRLSGRSQYLEEIQRQLESWMEQNRFQCGINWASALEVGFRALSWIWVYHLAGGDLPEGFRRRWLRELYRHGCHLERNFSHYFSRNTHLIGEAVALHALGVLFPSFPRAARWARQGGEVVRRELGYQVRADGSHFEQSGYYHVYALDFFLLDYLLSGRPAERRPVLARMAEYLDALLGAGRSLPLVGDDDGGRVFHSYGRCTEFGRATLATCAVALGEDREFAPADLYPQAVWWLGEEAWAAVAKTGPRCGSRSRLFAGAGLAILRAGPFEAIVDAGPFGAGRGGHSHSDTLSVVARYGGEEILVDAGTFTYVTDSAWRDWFRGSAAHNTVRVNGRNQAEARPWFGWRGQPLVRIREWASAESCDFLDAECRYGGVLHRRRVLLLKPALLFVLDDVEGPEEALLEQFWHAGQPVTHLGAHAWQIGSCARLVFPSGSAVTQGQGGEHGWRSRVFGSREAAPFLCVAFRGRLPASLGAVLALHPPGPRSGLLVEAEGHERRLRYEGEPAVEVRWGEKGGPEILLLAKRERLAQEGMDRIDLEDARATLAEAEEKGTIPLEEARKRLRR